MEQFNFGPAKKQLSSFTGASGVTGGSSGLVPAPAAGDDGKCLMGDGTWGVVDALPAVTPSDNGKVLKVASGDWSVEDEQDISGLAPKASPVFTASVSMGRASNSTVGSSSFAMGSYVTASGSASHAEGGGTTASGSTAHAEGSGTTASGDSSHAEGGGTRATAQQAHSEGGSTQASGFSSHAEGGSTTASNQYAHAEGSGTTASGEASHAEGTVTNATHKSQHVGGEYNTLDSSTNAATARGNYVEIIGNGSSYSARSNARTLDWSGNERLMGDIYVGCNADSTGGTKLQNATVMTGATGSTGGSAGLVPAPSATDNEKYLRGDGTWQTTPYPSTMTGATGSTGGSAGLVPSPAAGDEGKYLKGDGTWGEITSYNRQFWTSAQSASVSLAADGKTYLIWTAGSSAGTLGAMMDATNGAVVIVSNGEYAVLHKGSGITVSVANDELTVAASTGIKMAIVEL